VSVYILTDTGPTYYPLETVVEVQTDSMEPFATTSVSFRLYFRLGNQWLKGGA